MQILHHNSQGKDCSKELYQIVLFAKGSKNISNLCNCSDIGKKYEVSGSSLSQEELKEKLNANNKWLELIKLSC